jgi:hypothetical protein
MGKNKPPIEGIESGLDKVESKPEPDAEDRLEDAAVEKSAAETKILLESARDSSDIRSSRRLYGKRFFILSIVYMIYVAILTIMQGFTILGFSLNSTVLVALIGVPVLGYVVKIIFASSK